MKTTWILLSVTYFFDLRAALAQKRINVPLYRNSDTSIAYTWAKRDSKKVGLLDLTTTNQTVHCRFWMSNQAVDIWTTDKQQFAGSITSYTTPHHSREDKQDNKPELVYQDSKSIDPIIAQQIHELARSQSIFDIPDQNQIKGWSLGSDGYSVSIEYATPSSYSLKRYWGPHYQHNLREAQVIDSFYEYLELTLSMSWRFQ